MHPAIRSGWYVLVEPNGVIQQGEYVLVKLNDGRSTVKELLWHKNGEYALLAIANDARLTVAEADVGGIYPIAAVLPPSKRKL
jgi:SOS-response transcriptional repressor LexA